MPRNLTSGQIAALSAPVIYLAFFFQATFKTGPVYMWTGYGSIQPGDGNTYLGIGTLGGISSIEEGSTVNARNVTFTLSGIDPTVLSAVLGEFQLGAPCALKMGLFSASNTLIDGLIPSYVGRMDEPTIDISGGTAIISIATESRLIDMNIICTRRLTNDDQQLDHPGDTAFEFVFSIQELLVQFGPQSTNSNNL